MLKDNFLLELTKQYETPFYIYNGNVIEYKYKQLQNAFANCSNFQVNYAMKALSSIAILKLMHQLGSCVDTVSIHEVKLAFLAGFNADEIFFTPNGTPFHEIKEAANLGVNITLDNIIQIEQYAKLNVGNSIAIRINPNIKAGGNKKITVAKKKSKFGLSISKVDKLHKLIKECGLQIHGFHIHLGSDILSIDSFKNSANVLFSIAKQFKNLKFINFGGGFKVKYKSDDDFININEIGLQLTNAFNDFKVSYNNEHLKLIIEPGKFLVSNSGLFLTEVTTIKDRNIFINSGFNHLIRPMYYDAYHHIRNISNTKISTKKYHIVGYICEQDFFGKSRTLNKPHVGDIICIENAGAYSFTMASNYNSRLRPMELLHYNEETKIIRKKECFKDLVQNQIF